MTKEVWMQHVVQVIIVNTLVFKEDEHFIEDKFPHLWDNMHRPYS